MYEQMDGGVSFPLNRNLLHTIFSTLFRRSMTCPKCGENCGKDFKWTGMDFESDDELDESELKELNERRQRAENDSGWIGCTIEKEMRLEDPSSFRYLMLQNILAQSSGK